MLVGIKLDYKLVYRLILQIENLRNEFFPNPFSSRLKELGQSMMKSYEVCGYFRNPSQAENTRIIGALVLVMYRNMPYSEFLSAIQSKLKFALNDRFFDFFEKFMVDELAATDSKSVLDV